MQRPAGHSEVARRPRLPLSGPPHALRSTKQLSPSVQLNSALLPGRGMLRHQFMAPVGRENRAILLCEEAGLGEWGGIFSVE